MLFMNRKSLVLQERLFFRNIPLSNWVEHEMVVEEGADIDKLAKKYMDVDEYPFRKEDETRLIIKIAPDKVVLNSPS